MHKFFYENHQLGLRMCAGVTVGVNVLGSLFTKSPMANGQGLYPTFKNFDMLEKRAGAVFKETDFFKV